MGISLYNHERYLDPTAHEALTNIEKEEKRKIVFICSPFAGDIEGNIMRARRYGRFAVSEQVVPIIPHLMYPQLLDEHDPKERQLGIDMGLVLLSKCHEIWVFGDRISSGMAVEIKHAKRSGIIIRHFNDVCVEKTNT